METGERVFLSGASGKGIGWLFVRNFNGYHKKHHWILLHPAETCAIMIPYL